MSAPVLQLTGLEAGFGSNLVLQGVDLDVPAGSCTGIFGLNGAGKSVTMKVAVGLVPAWAGTVMLDGKDITKHAPEARARAGMAYTPQGRQLFSSMTVQQNLRLGGYLIRRRDRKRYNEVLDSIYTRFPRLYERRTQAAGSLSGGEQAMLAVGRALAGEPKVLLIDEPSAGLAPAVMAEVSDLLHGLRAEGLTMLLVEQNISFGFALVTRAAIMQSGRVVYEGDVADLDRDRVVELLGIGRLLSGSLDRALGREPAPGSKAAAGKSRRTAG